MNFYMTHQVERRSEVFMSSAYRVDDVALDAVQLKNWMIRSIEVASFFTTGHDDSHGQGRDRLRSKSSDPPNITLQKHGWPRDSSPPGGAGVESNHLPPAHRRYFPVRVYGLR